MGKDMYMDIVIWDTQVDSLEDILGMGIVLDLDKADLITEIIYPNGLIEHFLVSIIDFFI